MCSAVRRRARGIAAVVVLSGLAACASGAARVTIPTGATMRVAADSLHAAGVVRFPRLFRAYASVARSDRGIRPGTYVIDRGSSWGSILGTLRSGRGLMTVITIPEGFALSQIEPLLSTKLAVPPDSVTAATHDTVVLRRLRAATPSVEGYLFPDTYFFAPGTSARVAVSTMVRRFEQQWQPGWSARLDTLGASRNDIITLASIIELEAKMPAERPVIAGVYWNRLRHGMLLQADPTVQYALPKHEARVLNKDLAVVSPYNTYRHRGLPPGPICSPGLASLRAVIFPASVPYRYFVAMPDGHHEFRVSLAEHEQAVRVARRAWDATRAATKQPSPRTTRSRG
jgi:UPF0755 protein